MKSITTDLLADCAPENRGAGTAAASALLDLFLPRICPLCKEKGVETNFCAECAAGLEKERLTCACCSVCSEPFISQETAGHTCGACIKTPPPFVTAKSLYLFKGFVLDAVHKLKYGGDVNIARPLGAVMLDKVKEMDVRPELIVPVPLHKSRLKRRCFNQSLLIAKAVAGGLGVALDYKGLKRIRDTGAQVGHNRKERAENIKGAFKVVRPEGYSGTTVLLVDDVYTTGATMRECGSALKGAGATVYAITVARASKF